MSSSTEDVLAMTHPSSPAPPAHPARTSPPKSPVPLPPSPARTTRSIQSAQGQTLQQDPDRPSSPSTADLSGSWHSLSIGSESFGSITGSVTGDDEEDREGDFGMGSTKAGREEGEESWIEAGMGSDGIEVDLREGEGGGKGFFRFQVPDPSSSFETERSVLARQLDCERDLDRDRDRRKGPKDYHQDPHEKVRNWAGTGVGLEMGLGMVEGCNEGLIFPKLELGDPNGHPVLGGTFAGLGAGLAGPGREGMEESHDSLGTVKLVNPHVGKGSGKGKFDRSLSEKTVRRGERGRSWSEDTTVLGLSERVGADDTGPTYVGAGTGKGSGSGRKRIYFPHSTHVDREFLYRDGHGRGDIDERIGEIGRGSDDGLLTTNESGSRDEMEEELNMVEQDVWVDEEDGSDHSTSGSLLQDFEELVDPARTSLMTAKHVMEELSTTEEEDRLREWMDSIEMKKKVKGGRGYDSLKRIGLLVIPFIALTAFALITGQTMDGLLPRSELAKNQPGMVLRTEHSVKEENDLQLEKLGSTLEHERPVVEQPNVPATMESHTRAREYLRSWLQRTARNAYLPSLEFELPDWLYLVLHDTKMFIRRSSRQIVDVFQAIPVKIQMARSKLSTPEWSSTGLSVWEGRRPWESVGARFTNGVKAIKDGVKAVDDGLERGLRVAARYAQEKGDGVHLWTQEVGEEMRRVNRVGTRRGVETVIKARDGSLGLARKIKLRSTRLAQGIKRTRRSLNGNLARSRSTIKAWHHTHIRRMKRRDSPLRQDPKRRVSLNIDTDPLDRGSPSSTAQSRLPDRSDRPAQIARDLDPAV